MFGKQTAPMTTDPAAITADVPGGYEVRRGQRVLSGAFGEKLCIPQLRLAQAVAAEWSAADATTPVDGLPLARLAMGAADVTRNRAAVEEAATTYVHADLLCYRAEADANDLADRQAAAWDPLLAWAGDTYGAGLAVTAGVVPVRQPADAVAQLAAAVRALGDAELTAVRLAAAVTGSLVVALALTGGHIDAGAAWRAGVLDEHAQAEQWGTDAEAEEGRERLRGDLEAAAAFLDLCRDDGE
jgi:chaperone required for assembly of F1-ATPase